MFNVIISFIFLAVGFFFLGLTLYNLYLNNKNGYWLVLYGKIKKSEIIKRIDEYSLGTDPYSSSTDVNFEEDLEYEYTYENEKFTSTKIYYLDVNRNFLLSKEKKELISKYPLGKKIVVYIDPKNTKNAFIEKNIPKAYTLIYALVSLAIGIYFYY